MYCRTCGNQVNDQAEICVSCGCRPLIGKAYCQECGAETLENQELCVRCGVRLKATKAAGTQFDFKDVFENGYSTGEQSINMDFSGLSHYYQNQFQQMYLSNESYKGKFNWCAFLFGPIWAFTKGLWLSAIISIILSVITGGTASVIYWFIFGFRGNYMYYCAHTKGKQRLF